MPAAVVGVPNLHVHTEGGGEGGEEDVDVGLPVLRSTHGVDAE